MLKQHEGSAGDTAALMADLGRWARAAARPLAIASTAAKNEALAAMAAAILRSEKAILEANAIDLKNGEEAGLAASFMDRLTLTPERVAAIAGGIREIAALKDPVGDVIAQWDRPNGLHIERVRTPLGVVGVIYESRPNVTADAGALCLKAGNAVVLRGGSDSLNSSGAIHSSARSSVNERGTSSTTVWSLEEARWLVRAFFFVGLQGRSTGRECSPTIMPMYTCSIGEMKRLPRSCRFMSA